MFAGAPRDRPYISSCHRKISRKLKVPFDDSLPNINGGVLLIRFDKVRNRDWMTWVLRMKKYKRFINSCPVQVRFFFKKPFDRSIGLKRIDSSSSSM
jgi:hypothetical protein